MVLVKQASKILAAELPLLFDAASWDLIIPVPTSPKTFAQRGFNQTVVLASEIAKAAKHALSTICFDLILHLPNRPAQASLGTKARFKNARESFVLADNAKKLAGKRVLLVDDVITTGATSSSISSLLVESGAQMVDLIALARVNSWVRWL